LSSKLARWLPRAVVAIGCLPAVALAVAAALGELGAEPIETITHTTGEWGLRCLLASLAVTPLRRLTGFAALAPCRRPLGLLAFGYASAHLATWLGLEHFLDWAAIFEDIFERPYVTAGMAAFLCMLPLAVTSTRGWQRRLGRRWVRLHRLAYVAGVAAVLHYLWLVKADLAPPLVHAAILAMLLGARLWWARGRR